MKSLRFTIRGDGPSDDMLIPVVAWVLRQHVRPDIPVNGQYAERFGQNTDRRKGLAGSINVSLGLAPCDLLVVHRDAERDDREKRVREIQNAIAELLADQTVAPPHVCLVPVRMSEAWLLFDEPAIRAAAGNPNGKASLRLPAPRTIEGLPDPKTLLRELVKTASELTGRRLKKLETASIPRNVAEFIDDFAPLRKLSAFRAFEAEVKAFAEGWQAAD